MRSLCAALVLFVTTLPGVSLAADRTLVFAAASLGSALSQIEADWEAAGGTDVVISYAGSSQLARQIELGAPAELFISANEEWMDHLAQKALIRPETRRDLLSNTLVLIATGTGAPAQEIGSDFDLPTLLGEGRLAMALIDSVPAGIYGREALGTLGLWSAVETRVAQADNVRAALALVASGAAPLGIVYATDAGAEDNVTVVGRFPEGSHAPIRYPAALTVRAGKAASDFLAYLGGPEARAVFVKAGFGIPDAALAPEGPAGAAAAH